MDTKFGKLSECSPVVWVNVRLFLDEMAVKQETLNRCLVMVAISNNEKGVWRACRNVTNFGWRWQNNIRTSAHTSAASSHIVPDPCLPPYCMELTRSASMPICTSAKVWCSSYLVFFYQSMFGDFGHDAGTVNISPSTRPAYRTRSATSSGSSASDIRLIKSVR